MPVSGCYSLATCYSLAISLRAFERVRIVLHIVFAFESPFIVCCLSLFWGGDNPLFLLLRPFTESTGVCKTIIMASFIESVFFENKIYACQTDVICVRIFDSPELNEQSKLKIDT